jgi:cytochrome P450
MDVDLFAPETQEDWYPTYDHLRDQEPAYRVPGTDEYVITRYDDIMHVLRHQKTFPTGASKRRSAAAQQVYDRGGWERMTPLGTNPPVHRHYRQLIDHFFTGPGLERSRPFIERVIDEQFAGFERDGVVEWNSQYAVPVPVRVITHLLGLPDDDIPRLKQWSAAWILPFVRRLQPDEDVWVAEQVVEMYDYLADAIAAKRREPADDIITHLTQVEFTGDGSQPEGRPLTDQEIITIVDHLFIGGNETTTFAMTSALWIMLRDEGRAAGLDERLRADAGLIPNFVEEVLRLESPTQGLWRAVAADTEIAGVPIAAGSTVHLRYAAGNRDARMFECPHEVRLDRENSRRHLAFTLGEHHCPGADLSRLEQVLTLEHALRRLPNLRLAPGRNDFTHVPMFTMRALRELHLEFDNRVPGTELTTACQARS